MGTAYLSLGSNVEPERHLRAAVAALRARFGDVRRLHGVPGAAVAAMG